VSTQGALRERAALLEELRQIVQAMKNLAFAETQRLAHAQPALAAARDAVMQALERVPAAPPGAPLDPGRPPCWLVIGAERGFCGAFNDRVAEGARQLAAGTAGLRLLAAGQRLNGLLGSLPCPVVALGGCATLDEVDATLEEWQHALALEAPRCGQIWMLHASEAGLVRRRLAPPERTAPSPAPAALRYLPDGPLRSALLRQAMRLQLEDGIFESLRQENRWRLSQMQRAQDHLDDLSQQLRRRYAALRQENITNEQETLMSSLQASGAPGGDQPASWPLAAA
jgi:F-type H+-transporting ATPase subunit gamma